MSQPKFNIGTNPEEFKNYADVRGKEKFVPNDASNSQVDDNRKRNINVDRKKQQIMALNRKAIKPMTGKKSQQQAQNSNGI